MLASTPAASVRERLGGRAGERCAQAVETLAAESRPVRAAALAALIALVRAPVPAGVERIHPDWLRERLDRETPPVIRAVVSGLPAPIGGIAAEVLAARRQEATPAPSRDLAAVSALRRIVFAGFVPLAGASAPAGPVARSILALPLEASPAAIDDRGAETLGASLRRAPGPVVARTAAGLGGRVADGVVEAAAREGGPEAREAARTIVASVVAGTPTEKVREIGLRALAAAMSDEGEAAAIAVAQRLSLPLGRRWLEVAGLPGLL